MRSLKGLAFVGGVGFGVALIATCQPGSPGPAHASTVITANCDKVFTRTTTRATGDVSVETVPYADITTSIDPTAAPAISATVCGFQCFGNSCMPFNPTCNSGDTCTSTGTPPPQLDCQSGGANLAPGRIVVWCGAKWHYTSNGQPDRDEGQTYKVAYVRIE